jgi:hypothetical protein
MVEKQEVFREEHVPHNCPVAELAQIVGGSAFIEAARERLWVPFTSDEFKL